MNSFHIVVATALCIASSVSVAAVDYTDVAPVISSIPVYRQISVPREECWTESVASQTPPTARSNAGALIGAVTGGIVGNQVGRGRGRVAATVAGAVVGTIVGERLDNPQQMVTPSSQPVRRCRMADDIRHEIAGYDVTYRYGGKDVTVRLPYDPGASVRLKVEVL